MNQPKLIRDVAVKQKVLRVLESAARGINRLAAVTQHLDSTTVDATPGPAFADTKTLEQVVFGLGGLEMASTPATTAEKTKHRTSGT